MDVQIRNFPDRLRAVIVVMVLGVHWALALSAQTVVNGSFETDAVPPGPGFIQLSSGLSDWTIVSGAIDLVSGTAFPSATDGTNFIDLTTGSVGVIEQTITTTSGQAYTLSFDYGNFGDGLTVRNEDLLVEVLDGMTVLASTNLTTPPPIGGSLTPIEWQPRASLFFSAASASTTLRFTNTGSATGSSTGAGGVTLDNITVDLPPTRTDGLVYFTLPNCGVVNTSQAGGKLNNNEFRSFNVRGEGTDLSAQGGSATGCGVPNDAEAVVANFWVFSHDGNGKLRVGASDESLGAGVGTLIRYNEPDVDSYANATVVDLCSSDPCTSDFQVRAQGSGSKTHLAVDVMGYFAPLGEIAMGTTAMTMTMTETLTIAEDGGIELQGGDLVQTPSTPIRVGSVREALVAPETVVSGRFAYSLGQDNALAIIDVSNPAAPVTVSRATLASVPSSIAVVEPFAYVVYSETGELVRVDIGDPKQSGASNTTLSISGARKVAVSGDYAYVVSPEQLTVVSLTDLSNLRIVRTEPLGGNPGDSVDVTTANGFIYVSVGSTFNILGHRAAGELVQYGPYELPEPISGISVSEGIAYVLDGISVNVYDVSKPTNITAMAQFGTDDGTSIQDVFVAGRYAYLGLTTGIDIVDMAVPSAPEFLGAFVTTSGVAHSMAVDGHHAYVQTETALEVFELPHGEFAALTAHSLEAGRLSVLSDVVAQGDLKVHGGIRVGEAGIFSDGPIGVTGLIEFAPIRLHAYTPMSGAVRLFGRLEGDGAELLTQDLAGNITTLSPHNFSLVGEPSEPLAWSYYSENQHGKINVDMLRVVRLLEELSGEKLVHVDPAEGMSETADPAAETQSLRQQVQQLERKLEELMARLGK